MDACSEDIKKWCADIQPGGGKLGACLYAHWADLSEPCKKFAGHGGKGAEKESLLDIDRGVKPAGPGTGK